MNFWQMTAWELRISRWSVCNKNSFATKIKRNNNNYILLLAWIGCFFMKAWVAAFNAAYVPHTSFRIRYANARTRIVDHFFQHLLFGNHWRCCVCACVTVLVAVSANLARIPTHTYIYIFHKNNNSAQTALWVTVKQIKWRAVTCEFVFVIKK